MGPNIKIVNTQEDINVTSALASEIWNEHYTPIIGKRQVDYMVAKYQSAEAIKKQIDSEGYLYYLICFEDKPVGYIGFQLRNRTVFLSKYYVRHISRGKGLGRFAMEFLKIFAKNHNADSIYLTVNKNNIKSIDAYLKMGFKNEGPIVTDIGNGFVMDDYKMILNF